MHFSNSDIDHHESYELKNNQGSSITNPQIQIHHSYSPNTHLNPIFNRHKPFIAQNKHKNIASHKEQHNNQHPKINANTANEEICMRHKSNSFVVQHTDKNVSKYDYIAFACKQHKLQKEESKQGGIKLSHNSYHQANLMNGDPRILLEQNKHLKEKIKKIEIELDKQRQTIFEKQKEIQEKRQQLNRQLEQINITQLKQQEREFNYNQLINENRRYKENQEYYLNLNNNYLLAVDHCSQLEKILKQKDEFVEDTLKRKAQQYNSAVLSKANEIKSLEQIISILEKQNLNLKEEMSKLTLSKGQQSQREFKFREAGQQFEIKINELTDQKFQLKNLINKQESKIQQLNMQKRSLENMVKALEEREKIDKNSKLMQQIEYLKELLQKQQEENDSHVSKLQLKILKLENQISNNKYQQKGSLLDFTDQQRIFYSYTTLLKEHEQLKKKISPLN